MNNHETSYKYYQNYDKNIKSIYGSGQILPSNPPNKFKTTDTIDKYWKKNIIPTPPLFKYKNNSDPNYINGYLDSNNYIQQDNNINAYYYPSQKFNNIININSKNENIKNCLNDINPIKFPPELIIPSNNDLNYSKELTICDNLIQNNLKSKSKSKSKSKIKSNHKLNIKNKSNLNSLTESDYKLIEFIKNNSLYDGKYIYTIENINSDNNNQILNSDDNNQILNSNNITYIPCFSNIEKQLKPTEFSNTLDFLKIKNYENFISETKNLNLISNINLLIIFSILLIIYFLKHQK